MPARHVHRRLEIGVGPGEHVLGLPPLPELDQHRRLHAVAMAGQEHGPARDERDEAAPAKQISPGSSPSEIGGVVARGEEGADRLGRGIGVIRLAARQRHRFVEQCHAVGNPTGLHVGQPGVGQRLRLEVDVTEPTGAIERQFRSRQELSRVIDVTSHPRHRHPTLLQARRLVFDKASRPSEPRPACRQIAHRVGEEVAQSHAGHRGTAFLVRGGEAANGSRQMGNDAVDIAARVRLIGVLERPFRFRYVSHHSRMAPEGRARGWVEPSADVPGCPAFEEEAHDSLVPATIGARSGVRAWRR